MVEVSTTAELIDALREPLRDVTVHLAPGEYVLPPTAGVDHVRTCEGDSIRVPVTTGLIVSGSHVSIRGDAGAITEIVTDANYRIYFKACTDCAVENLRVRGTPADSVADANDAAIVVARGSVRITNCSIEASGAASARLLSPQGGDAICARDGAQLTVEYSELGGSSWGIVLQKGTRALIRNNEIGANGGGGLLAMCDASATIERNHIGGSECGIRATDSSVLNARANIIESVPGTGISVDAHRGPEASVAIRDNVIYRCNLPGIRVTSPGRVSGNLLVENAQKDGTVSVLDVSEGVVVRGNTLYRNRTSDGREDGSNEVFRRAHRKWTQTYRNTPVGVDGAHRFYQSAFLTRYGRWLY